MAELEKVIRGLECCTNPDMSMCLDECPYHIDGCSGGIKMMRDALTLLKAQEPRVMTVKELEETEEACEIEASAPLPEPPKEG